MGREGEFVFPPVPNMKGRRISPPALTFPSPSQLPSFREPIGSWVRVTGSHKVSSLLRFQDNTVILCSTSDQDQALGINDLQPGRAARVCCSAFRMTRIPSEEGSLGGPENPCLS